MPMLNLSALAPSALPPIVYGENRWQFTTADLATGACLALSALMQEWATRFQGAANAAGRGEYLPEVRGVLDEMRASMVDLLAALFAPRYPEMDHAALTALPDPVLVAVASFFARSYVDVMPSLNPAMTLMFGDESALTANLTAEPLVIAQWTETAEPTPLTVPGVRRPRRSVEAASRPA